MPIEFNSVVLYGIDLSIQLIVFAIATSVFICTTVFTFINFSDYSNRACLSKASIRIKRLWLTSLIISIFALLTTLSFIFKSMISEQRSYDEDVNQIVQVFENNGYQVLEPKEIIINDNPSFYYLDVIDKDNRIMKVAYRLDMENNCFYVYLVEDENVLKPLN